MLRPGNAPAERWAAPRVAASRSSYWVGRLTRDATYARTRANTSGETPTLGYPLHISGNSEAEILEVAAVAIRPSKMSLVSHRIPPPGRRRCRRGGRFGSALGGRPIPSVCIGTAADISEHAQPDRDCSFRPQPIAEEPAAGARGHSCSHERGAVSGTVLAAIETSASGHRRPSWRRWRGIPARARMQV